ncbi:hypothetical protein DFH27DRAFT_607771 [Peziza echinospora]|nr:hypothetical protein DFH27DRAFT_607771 [Peziza echinospora]
MDDERWELRSSGLGCAVSTRTFLSVWASVLATLVFIALVYWGYYLWKRRERRRREWSLWGESGGYGGDEGGIWAWLGLDDVFGPWREEWGGWTRGWLLWRREEPERRVPGAWDDGEEEEGVGERRSLLRG